METVVKASTVQNREGIHYEADKPLWQTNITENESTHLQGRQKKQGDPRSMIKITITSKVSIRGNRCQ